MDAYLIIADDFTGANDTGVQLTRRGYAAKVVMDGAAILDDGCCYVLDAESRNIPEAEAHAKLARLLHGVDFSRFTHVIKKVDSTLRGNIAAEIRALADAFPWDLVVFMPALPALGRTTVDGVHLLKGTRILDTELARDPKKPVTEDRLHALLQQAFGEQPCRLGLADIRSGRLDLSQARLFACDAETDEDMQNVVAAALQTKKRTLWVGSAGIADNLLEATLPAKPALALVASVSDVTRGQMRHAAKNGAEAVIVDVASLLGGQSIEPYIQRACHSLSGRRDTLVLSSATWDRAELDRCLSLGAAQGMDADAVGRFAAEAMGKIGVEIVRRRPISGIFLCGGDTAISFFTASGAKGARITQEITVGIPMMGLSGGIFDGLKVVTKAGAFGAEDALPAILRKLREA